MLSYIAVVLAGILALMAIANEAGHVLTHIVTNLPL